MAYIIATYPQTGLSYRYGPMTVESAKRHVHVMNAAGTSARLKITDKRVNMRHRKRVKRLKIH